MSPLEMFSKQSMQVSPQTTITQSSQLQQQLSPTHPSSNLQSIPTTAQMTMMGMMERVRHESASTDRESEIRHIFDHGRYLQYHTFCQILYNILAILDISYNAL